MIPGKKYNLEDVALIAWRRKWWALVPAVVIAAGSYVWVRTLQNQYLSDTLILVVPQRVPESYVKSTVTTRIEDRLQSITQQILSRTRLERIIQDFNLYSDVRKTAIMEDVVDKMRGSINVQVVKGDAFRVSFTSTEARTAMRVTERLASLFIEENLRDREVLAEGTNQFLEAQLEDARRRLIETERKVEEYKRRFDGELPDQRDANMRVDAESSTGPVWSTANDPRVTPVGNFLRRTRLDEMPQLWNVLTGEMSFVGPRPERPEFVQQLTNEIPFYGQRHVVKPGLTGWAQVRYTYGATVEDAVQKLQYDLYYIKNMAIALDVVIVVETIKTVIMRKGAR